MKDPQKEFGLVRMGGTIGWILAAWLFTFILVDWAKVNASNPQGLSAWIGAALANGLTGPACKAPPSGPSLSPGIASLVLAAFSLTLPPTPPKPATGENKLAWLESVRFLKHPFILVLWVVTFIDSFVHNCYFNWTGTFLGSKAVRNSRQLIMPVMSIGQVAGDPDHVRPWSHL